jgi:EAL domain-containing protein (putative c-di-GMP-specific phosphodiesterase class I)
VHLEHILANARLMTLLQPILNLIEGRVMGYRPCPRTIKQPAACPAGAVRAAEQNGMLTALDGLARRSDLCAAGSAGRLFVNLSPASLQRIICTDAVLTALADAAWPAIRY